MSRYHQQDKDRPIKLLVSSLCQRVCCPRPCFNEDLELLVLGPSKRTYGMLVLECRATNVNHIIYHVFVLREFCFFSVISFVLRDRPRCHIVSLYIRYVQCQRCFGDETCETCFLFHVAVLIDPVYPFLSAVEINGRIAVVDSFIIQIVQALCSDTVKGWVEPLKLTRDHHQFNQFPLHIHCKIRLCLITLSPGHKFQPDLHQLTDDISPRGLSIHDKSYSQNIS